MRAWDEGRSFRSLLEADDRLGDAVHRLDEAFDLNRSLRHVGRVFEELAAIEL
jgi:hypothetical protein